MADTVIRIPGSATILGGHPAILDLLDDFIDDFDVTVRTLLDDLATELTASVQEDASKLDGWRDIAPYISVAFEDDSFVYYISPEAEERASVLEFGSQGQPPTAFLRRTASRQAHDLSIDFSIRFTQEVPVG